jgi:nucleotide-binding universal stress UspA family protein
MPGELGEIMVWKPIVAGVDPSDEGIRAAQVARELATLADAEYHLVHVTHDVSNVPASFRLPVDLGELRQRVSEQARRTVEEALADAMPDIELDRLEVRLGSPALGLMHAAQFHEAGLVVLGRKHHLAPTRWLGGSTVHHAVRTIDVPMFLAEREVHRGCRILVSVDLTYATGPTLEIARKFRELLDAKLMIVHVAEPLPVVPDVAIQLDEYAHYPAVAEEFERQIMAGLDNDADVAEIHRGYARDVVRDVAVQWEADIVVVGSHGKNWADRVMLGSTTEQLINRLATSMIVVPVRAPKAATTTVMNRMGTRQGT